MFKKFKESRLNDEEKSKAVAKVLGEAIGFDISDPALKVKNLLLGLSIILLAMVVGGISVGKTVSFLGISLEGITGNKMVLGLVIAVAWVTFHYAWYAIETCKEWRLRLTGQRVAYQTGVSIFASPDSEAPSNPKHATLYNWWKEKHYTFNSMDEAIVKVETELEGIQEKLDEYLKREPVRGETPNMAIFSNLLMAVNSLNDSMSKNMEFMKNQRIEASLYRFDKWFWRLITIQNIRVFVVEMALPLILGIVSFVCGVWYMHANAV